MTTTPLDTWMAMWRAGLGLAETGRRMAETMHAAGAVIDSRTKTMAAATRDPLNADHRELARMMPEKVDAFGRAATSAWSDLGAIQSETMAYWQQFASLAMAARAPTATEAAALFDRSTRIAERSIGLGGRALAPVHASATANAKRLGRSRTR